ncbi:MAG: GNAT family N-acetyltransferase [Candidatus Izemoplasmatales bacterium]
MIRLLNDSDKTMVLKYLYEDLNYNIFIIGDIEKFGMRAAFQRVYGEFDESHQLLSVFLRYRENAVYYADKIHFNKDYLEIFKKDPFEYFSGKTELTDLIKPYLKDYKNKHMYFCYADAISEEVIEDKRIETLQTLEDAGMLFDLLASIEEFNFSKKDKESFISQKINEPMGITLLIKEDKMIVSTVATTAETSKNAMVVAVATHKDYRNKGYASLLMKALMKIYIQDLNKSLCLFYDNPSAGKIYHHLGFETIGTWDMFHR